MFLLRKLTGPGEGRMGCKVREGEEERNTCSDGRLEPLGDLDHCPMSFILSSDKDHGALRCNQELA